MSGYVSGSLETMTAHICAPVQPSSLSLGSSCSILFTDKMKQTCWDITFIIAWYNILTALLVNFVNSIVAGFVSIIYYYKDQLGKLKVGLD